MGTRRPWTEEEQKEAERLRAEGASYKAIGRALGRDPSVVRRAINPAARERQREWHREWLRERMQDPAARERRREQDRERMQDPAARERRREQDRERMQDPAARELHRERQRVRMQDPAARERHRERDRRATAARRERERGTALPVTSRVPSVSPELRDEIRRRVIAEGGGPGDVPLIIREAGWLNEDPTSPWFGDQRIALWRIEVFAAAFSRSWIKSTRERSGSAPRATKNVIAPCLRETRGTRSTSYQAFKGFGRFGKVSRSFPTLTLAKGWLVRAVEVYAAGGDPREISTFVFNYPELEELGRNAERTG